MITGISQNQTQSRQNFGSVKLSPDYKATLTALRAKNPVKALQVSSAVAKNRQRQRNNVLFDLFIGLSQKGKLAFEVLAKNPEQSVYAQDLTKEYAPKWYHSTGLINLKKLSQRLRDDSKRHQERITSAEKLAPQIASHKPYMI